MSELLIDARKRKDLLKHMIRQLHRGEAPTAVRAQLARLLGEVPYGEVVEVEQELISDGLPAEDVLKLCDVHTEALRGRISHTGAKTAPPGHPVHTFKEENRALGWEITALNRLFTDLPSAAATEEFAKLVEQLRIRFNAVSDVDKHYLRKEHLLFPFLEKHGITGPPTVMWGKHDETRELLRAALDALRNLSEPDFKQLATVIELVLKPAARSVEEMIFKEEEILLPMCMDTLTDAEWYHVYRQSPEVGFCLYDPTDEWKPSGLAEQPPAAGDDRRLRFPTGSMTPAELNAVLNTIPFDLTFVDKDDTVRYYSHGRERVFARSRAVLGRQVQLCHPPSSVGVVQRIIDDFRSGRQTRAPFWITLKGRFIHIEYFALRDEQGNYLGTLEVSQDLTEKRALTGEQRLLNYASDEGPYPVR